MKRLMLLTVLATLGLTGTALASNPVSDLARTGKDHSSSTNWSGYAAYNSTFSDVKGDFIVPTANCSGLKRNQITIASPWVGLDGYFSSTVEQTGVDVECLGANNPAYVAWYEFYPAGSQNLSNPVQAGDHMRVEVAQAGNTVTTTLQNLTSPRTWTSSHSQSANGLAFSSAEWIMEAPTQTLTNFGTVSFSNSAATDGSHSNAAISAFTNDAITMVSKNGRTIRATPGSLSNGTAFQVQFNHG
ncbi:MAG: G1 family glutamic endopeptidase [Gaiellaceae bacterium]